MASIDRVKAVLRSLGPVVTRAALLESGVSVRAIASVVKSGDLVRIRRAHYSLPGEGRGEQEDWAVAVALGGRLGGCSAARSYGWWVGLDTRLHVSWSDHGNIAKPGRIRFAFPENRTLGDRTIVSHWRMPQLTPPTSNDCWRESPEHSLAQSLVTLDRSTAIACADSAIRLGSLTAAQVQAVFDIMPRRVERWRTLVDGRSDSGLETMIRVWLIDHGIRFRLHARIRDVGVVDFLVGRSLIIETDGSEFHDGVVSRHRDYRRDGVAGSLGFITARFGYSMIMHQFDECARRIWAHLDRRDHLRAVESQVERFPSR